MPSIEVFLRTKAIPFGLFVQLTGLLWLGNNSGYMTQTYIWCLLPALISIIITLLQPSTLIQIKTAGLIPKLLGIMFLWILIHPFFINNQHTEYSKLITRILYIITYIYAVAVTAASLKNPERLLLSCAALASLFALASIINQYGFNGYTYASRTLAIYGQRLYSLGFGDFARFGNPILASLYYGSFAALVMGWAATKRFTYKSTAIAGLCIIPLIAYTILSDSRGPIIATLVTIIGTYILIFHPKPKKTILVTFLLSTVLSLILFGEIKQTALNIINSPSNLYIRWDIWEEAIALISEHPMLGYGVNTPINLDIGLYTFHHPHNMLLKISLNWGLFGGFLFIALTITGLYQAWKNKHMPIAAIAFALLLFGTVGMLTDTYKFLSRPGLQWHLFFLPLGLIIGAIHKKKRLSDKITTEIK